MNATNLEEIMETARNLEASARRGRESKLDVARDFIITAHKEKIRPAVICATLEIHYGLKATRENLRAWAIRQPELRRLVNRKPKPVAEVSAQV